MHEKISKRKFLQLFPTQSQSDLTYIAGVYMIEIPILFSANFKCETLLLKFWPGKLINLYSGGGEVVTM